MIKPDFTTIGNLFLKTIMNYVYNFYNSGIGILHWEVQVRNLATGHAEVNLKSEG